MEEIGEAELAEAVAAGKIIDRPGTRVDAQLLRKLCVHRDREVDPRGISLRGVQIVNELDLTAVEVPFALRFEKCTFEVAPVILGAKLRELAFVDCPELPGLLANGIELGGDLDLSRSRIVGHHRTDASVSQRAAIWLCESNVAGRIRFLDTTIDPQGHRAIQADRMRVGGTFRLLNNFHAMGELRFVGLHVSGSLDMSGARVESEGLAIDLGDATIEGNLYIAETSTRRPQVRGRINLSSTQIDGKLVIRDAVLVRPEHDESRYPSPRFEGKALVGLGLKVGAELSVGGSTTVTGGVDLSSAELGGFTIEPGSVIEAPGQTALDLTNAQVRSAVTLGEGVRVRGTTLFVGAHVHGGLDLDGVVLTEPQGHSLLKADGATIDGDVKLKRVQATGGQLKFWRTAIGGGFDAGGAAVDNAAGGTVRLHHAQVGGSVRLADGFTSTGCVVLSRSTVGGRLDLRGGRFRCPSPGEHNSEGAAIRAVSATFKGGMDLDWANAEPAVDVTDATTTVLRDDPSRWPDRVFIAGFTYDRLDNWDWQRRLAWLRRQPEHDAGPYEQAARVFRQHGYTHAAEQLLIKQRSDARQAERRTRRHVTSVIDWVFDWTVGYGYRPGRVLWLLVALLALVTATLSLPAVQNSMRATDEGVVFTIHGPLTVDRPTAAVDPCGGGRVRCFSPLLYAVDTVVPLIALDQRATWYPDRYVAGGQAVEWWLNLATMAGWLLSSIFLLSFARLART
jgi:hypothetical protein